MAQILVVDDELGIRNLLSEILNDEGFDVLTAEDAATAREQVRNQHIDLILLDIWMPDTDGVTLLKEWGANREIRCPVIMMSGHGTIETAMEATRFGAMDFLEKPISLKRLLSTVKRVLDEWAYRQKQTGKRDPAGRTPIAAPDFHSQRSAEIGQETAAKVPRIQQAVLKVSGPNRYTFLDGNEDPLIGPDKEFPVIEIPILGIVLDFNRSFREMRDDFERAYLTRALRYNGSSVAALSKHCELERTHLYRKMRSLDIDPVDFTGNENKDKPLPIYGLIESEKRQKI